jgi:hypothetical protein
MLTHEHNPVSKCELLVGPLLNGLLEGSARQEHRSRRGDNPANTLRRMKVLRGAAVAAGKLAAVGKLAGAADRPAAAVAAVGWRWLVVLLRRWRIVLLRR